MSRENPLWGAPWITVELIKFCIDIGETSVGRYMATLSKWFLAIKESGTDRLKDFGL